MSQASLCYAALESYLSTAQVKLPASFTRVADKTKDVAWRRRWLVDIFCRDACRFDPTDHGGTDVMTRMRRERDSSGDRRRVEGVRTGAAAAVGDARNHEEPSEDTAPLVGRRIV